MVGWEEQEACCRDKRSPRTIESCSSNTVNTALCGPQAQFVCTRHSRHTSLVSPPCCMQSTHDRHTPLYTMQFTALVCIYNVKHELDIASEDTAVAARLRLEASLLAVHVVVAAGHCPPLAAAVRLWW